MVQAGGGTAAVAAISNFVNSSAHDVTQMVIPTVQLANDISSLFGSSGTLKVVLFESHDFATPESFSFAPGVVFVEDSVLSHGSFSNRGGNLILDMAGGGTITLVGVFAINQTGHITAV